MLKKIEIKILLRTTILFVMLLLTSFFIFKGSYTYLFFLIPAIIILLYRQIKAEKKSQTEIDRFVESVYYRDFSRHFDVKHSPAELKPLRHGFNIINSAIRDISREKEASSQYLQKILEMVDTGIISFDMKTGEVLWMNDSLKNMLQLPYLKTLSSMALRDEPLYNELKTLKPGEERIITIKRENRPFKILLSGSAFQTDKRKFMLIAFQNISEAMDETESKAWKKLLSVMTHEIMNSVAPISSLADTLKKRLDMPSSDSGQDKTLMNDLEIGIETIRKRSDGLLKFAETYRSLNKVTRPVLKEVLVRDLFENIYRLMAPTLESKNIGLDIVLKDPGVIAKVDTALIEQVLINLVVNAADALKDKKEDATIVLSGHINERGEVDISVSDNGSGMTDEVLENIFVPFFTTKKNGSGIGLSLCKQIMKLHGGSIDVYSVMGSGTRFRLNFP